MLQQPTCPCETCGEPTTYTGTKRCNNCWEVEGRLDEYASEPNGRKRILEALVRQIEGSRSPTRQQLDAVTRALNNKAFSLAMNGGDDSEYLAIIAAIRWAAGLWHNPEHTPLWFKQVLLEHGATA